MFEVLEAGIEEVETPLDSAELAQVLGLLDRLTAKLSAAVGDFDHAGAWEADGATSMTAWLRHHGRMSGGAAASMARTAKRLRAAPATAAAWRNGVLSGGQVQAVVANVDERAAELFAAHEAALVPTLAPLSVRDTAWPCRRGGPGPTPSSATATSPASHRGRCSCPRPSTGAGRCRAPSTPKRAR